MNKQDQKIIAELLLLVSTTVDLVLQTAKLLGVNPQVVGMSEAYEQLLKRIMDTQEEVSKLAMKLECDML